VTSQYLNHPALTLGYRLEADGCAVVYASDHEPHAISASAEQTTAHLEDRRHVQFLEDADLVIHDAQYTLAEFPAKLGWGHSPIETVVDYAVAARARRLALHHHDPFRDDDAVERLADGARRRAALAAPGLEVFAAREGMEIELIARTGARTPSPTSVASCALLGEPEAPRSILFVTKRPASLRAVESILAAEALRIHRCDDTAAALRRDDAERPALVVIDAAEGREDDACRAFRDDARFASLPLLVLADASRGDDAMAASFRAGASDYLVNPEKATLLRSRVQSWLRRAGVR